MYKASLEFTTQSDNLTTVHFFISLDNKIYYEVPLDTYEIASNTDLQDRLSTGTRPIGISHDYLASFKAVFSKD